MLSILSVSSDPSFKDIVPTYKPLSSDPLALLGDWEKKEGVIDWEKKEGVIDWEKKEGVIDWEKKEGAIEKKKKVCLIEKRKKKLW